MNPHGIDIHECKHDIENIGKQVTLCIKKYSREFKPQIVADNVDIYLN